MKIAVLGSGLVGRDIIKDLARDNEYDIVAVDLVKGNLNTVQSLSCVTCVQADLSAANQIHSIIRDCDLVISSVPGFMGFQILKEIINCGKNVVDIAFFGEDPFVLDSLAKSKGVTAVVDCGVAPGLSNIIVGYLDTQLDRIERYVCYVGGLPKVRRWPYEYKAVFSPKDVLEEYTRPARFVESGNEVVKPALSDVENLDFPRIGTLQAFNTDGLRTLSKTMDIDFMIEKTLRYPGHAELMRVFRESGFFSADPIEIEGKYVSPLAFTSKLLFDQWKLREGEEDLTVMQIIVEGQKGASRRRYVFDLYDEFDHETGATSMARTTGYTCTITARQVLNGLFTRKGICPPEFIGGTDGCYQDLMNELEKRKIQLTQTVIELEEGF